MLSGRLKDKNILAQRRVPMTIMSKSEQKDLLQTQPMTMVVMLLRVDKLPENAKLPTKKLLQKNHTNAQHYVYGGPRMLSIRVLRSVNLH